VWGICHNREQADEFEWLQNQLSLNEVDSQLTSAPEAAFRRTAMSFW
jgi:hypothetical protein